MLFWVRAKSIAVSEIQRANLHRYYRELGIKRYKQGVHGQLRIASACSFYLWRAGKCVLPWVFP